MRSILNAMMGYNFSFGVHWGLRSYVFVNQSHGAGNFNMGLGIQPSWKMIYLSASVDADSDLFLGGGLSFNNVKAGYAYSESYHFEFHELNFQIQFNTLKARNERVFSFY